MKKEFSIRTQRIEELIFTKLNSYRTKQNLIDLSRGVPFGSPPRELIYELNMRSKFEENHIYGDMRGLKELRQEISYFYKETYDVDLDPETEVQVLIGSKEGIANLILACVNPGDSVVVPNPAFPVYYNAVRFARGEFTWAYLNEENNYLPNYKDLSSSLTGKEKLMLVNYPHSPTGAVCSLSDFEDMASFAKSNNIMLLHDAVYRELSFKKHPTLLQVQGAKDYSVEIGSLSKTFNMSGWRIAYMVGNREILEKLRSIKTIFDVGQFIPIQYAATLAMKMVSYIESAAEDYENKVQNSVSLLKDYGVELFEPGGSYSIWCKIPPSFKTSADFVHYMWEKHDVLFMPGSGFGINGESYFRISLTKSENEIYAGLKKLSNISDLYIQKAQDAWRLNC